MRLLFAVPKGRLLEESLTLLANWGIRPTESIQASRKLIFSTTSESVELALLRAQDVLAYVDEGAADLGIAGSDLLAEHRPQHVCRMIDLGIGRCTLMTARPGHSSTHPDYIKKVATKYPNLARDHYASRGMHIQPIKLYGSMELAPLLKIADEIVDVVSSGQTLKANNLVPDHTIMSVSSFLIVNQNALKTRHALIQPIIERARA